MLVASACDRDPVSPDRERTLADFQPYLTVQLTAADARARFGPPDEETGSGLRIYIYRFDDGHRLWLGFPGDAPIVYARLRRPRHHERSRVASMIAGQATSMTDEGE